MKNKAKLSAVQEDLCVDLTLHNVPAVLLEDFVLSVAGPYYSGSLSSALKALMQKAVADQEFLEARIKEVNR